MIVLQERLATIQTLHLESGSHEDFEKGMCVMEAAAYVAGENWSDHPPASVRYSGLSCVHGTILCDQMQNVIGC